MRKFTTFKHFCDCLADCCCPASAAQALKPEAGPAAVQLLSTDDMTRLPKHILFAAEYDVALLHGQAQ
jgi:hypothetical protein